MTVEMNLDGLDKLQENITTEKYVKVGILAGNVSREASGQSNIEIGMVQEFGSLTQSIPPRSFLRMPIEHKANEIVAFAKSKSVGAMFARGDDSQAFALLGIKGEEAIQDAFSTRGFGRWQPLSETTILQKGSSAPLIDTGQLRRSITSEVVE